MGGIDVGFCTYQYRTVATPKNMLFSFTCMFDESFFAYFGNFVVSP